MPETPALIVLGAWTAMRSRGSRRSAAALSGVGAGWDAGVAAGRPTLTPAMVPLVVSVLPGRAGPVGSAGRVGMVGAAATEICRVAPLTFPTPSAARTVTG